MGANLSASGEEKGGIVQVGGQLQGGEHPTSDAYLWAQQQFIALPKLSLANVPGSTPLHNSVQRVRKVMEGLLLCGRMIQLQCKAMSMLPALIKAD